MASVTCESKREREKECVTLQPSLDEEELKVVASESLIVLPLIIVILFLGVCGPSWFFPYFGFSTLISCVLVLHSWSVIVFLSVHFFILIFATT